MNILFLSQWFPFPANNGSKIRIYNLLQGLSQVHDITLFSFYNPRETVIDGSARYPFCSRVQLVPWKPFEAKSRKATLGLFSLTPRSLLDTHSEEMETLIFNAASHGKFDLIIASQLTMASYFPSFGGLPAIFEELELGIFVDQAFKNSQGITRLRSKLTWFKLQRYLSHLLDSFKACTVVSETEGRILIENFPQYANKVKVVPNCINVEDFQPIHIQSSHRRIIFSGSFRYRPNYAAMQWFVGEVFPLILKRVPEVELIITGDHENLSLPPAKNVTLTGYVDDIKSLIASCDVSLAPLWMGGGTRLKILEAMALGVPVVATSKGAEGLSVHSGQHLLIGDEPEAFAKQVVQLLENEDLRVRIAANALKLVQDRYNWPVSMPSFLRLVENVVSG